MPEQGEEEKAAHDHRLQFTQAKLKGHCPKPNEACHHLQAMRAANSENAHRIALRCGSAPSLIMLENSHNSNEINTSPNTNVMAPNRQMLEGLCFSTENAIVPQMKAETSRQPVSIIVLLG